MSPPRTVLGPGSAGTRALVLGAQLALLFSIPAMGANYLMNSGNNGQTINIADGDTFSDSGGFTGNYGNNQDFTTTFRAPVGNVIQVEFTPFDLQNGNDSLRLYDGSTAIGTYSSSRPPSFTMSGNTFTANIDTKNNNTRSGWRAALRRTTVPTEPGSKSDKVPEAPAAK